MYRQTHSSFGKANFRVSSLPENYSGNAFRTVRNIEEKEEEMPKPPINDEEPIKHDIQAELLPRKDAAVNTKELSSVSEKLNLSTDTVLLFIILLILSMGGGDRDDGAVFSILLLLMT